MSDRILADVAENFSLTEIRKIRKLWTSAAVDVFSPPKDRVLRCCAHAHDSLAGALPLSYPNLPPFFSRPLSSRGQKKGRRLFGPVKDCLTPIWHDLDAKWWTPYGRPSGFLYTARVARSVVNINDAKDGLGRVSAHSYLTSHCRTKSIAPKQARSWAARKA
jgi:hypothetical protein